MHALLCPIIAFTNTNIVEIDDNLTRFMIKEIEPN